MPQYKIRPGRSSDVPDLLRVEREGFPHGQFSDTQFRYYITRGQLWVVVAKEDQVLAYVSTSNLTSTGRLRIYSLATATSERGQGHATRLMTHLEKVIQPRRIILEVAETNLTAISVYVNKGYKAFGRYEDYYARGLAAMRMEKVYKHRKR
jgi:ribosomal protein S18 acetylase RimI-like enzyme